MKNNKIVQTILLFFHLIALPPNGGKIALTFPIMIGFNIEWKKTPLREENESDEGKQEPLHGAERTRIRSVGRVCRLSPNAAICRP